MSAFDPQDAFQQVTQRLDGLQASQNQIAQILLQTVDIQTGMLDTQNRMLNTQNQMLADIKQLQGSQLLLLKTQNKMLDYMKFTFDQQAKWNERQDQFNIIFLEELRDVKTDVRKLKDDVHEIKVKTIGEMDARLIKLEDFMNDQLRKAS